MPHRTFEIEQQPSDDSDPITFDLAGRKFTCVPAVPVGLQLVLGEGLLTRGAVMSFVEGVMQESEVDSWRELLRDRTVLVGYPTVEDIFWWLIDEYAERLGYRIAERTGDVVPTEAAGE